MNEMMNVAPPEIVAPYSTRIATETVDSKISATNQVETASFVLGTLRTRLSSMSAKCNTGSSELCIFAQIGRSPGEFRAIGT